MSRCLLAVATGAKYVAQTEGMIASFMAHNDGWDVVRCYDGDLLALMPQSARGWKAFDRCEIGRWLALRGLLNRYDTVLYSDGDMRWYGAYEPHGYSLTLSPHYITAAARRRSLWPLWFYGVANIGLVEMSSGQEAQDIIRFLVDTTMSNPREIYKYNMLWMQNMVSCINDCGFNVAYNNHPGCNVAAWNLKARDRRLEDTEEGVVVVTGDGERAPLISMHFSAANHGDLRKFGGPVAVRLLDEYLAENK